MSRSKFGIGLKINLISFTLPKDLINEDDNLRIGITSLPEDIKQHFYIKGSKMNTINHEFKLNITNKTKQIILVFRKKTENSEDPIIASVTIRTRDFSQFPKNYNQLYLADSINSDVKFMDLYYPLQKQRKEELKEGKKKMNRKVIGSMQIQLSFSTPFVNDDKNEKNVKSKSNWFSKNTKGDYEKLTNENDNNSLLD